MTHPTGTALDREDRPMTDRLDEIRERLAVKYDPTMCNSFAPMGCMLKDIARLVAEVDRLEARVDHLEQCALEEATYD